MQAECLRTGPRHLTFCSSQSHLGFLGSATKYNCEAGKVACLLAEWADLAERAQSEGGTDVARLGVRCLSWSHADPSASQHQLASGRLQGSDLISLAFGFLIGKMTRPSLECCERQQQKINVFKASATWQEINK